MRPYLASLVAVSLIATTAEAYSAEGNRANGLNYQPTPNQVVPREKAVGIQPPPAQKKANGQMLEQMDKNLLRQEGQSTNSVPKLSNGE